MRYCGQIELEMLCLLFLQRNGLKGKHCQVLVCICQMLVCLITISPFLRSGEIDASSSLYSILPQPASTLVLSLYWLHCSLLLLWELQMLLSSPRQMSPWESHSVRSSLLGHMYDWVYPPSSLARAEGASCGNALGWFVNCWCVSLSGNSTFMSTCKIFLGSLLADCLTMFLSLPVEVCEKFCIWHEWNKNWSVSLKALEEASHQGLKELPVPKKKHAAARLLFPKVKLRN